MERTEDDQELLTDAFLAAAHRELDADAQPPGAEELQDYLTGDLSEAESDRVRAWLVAHPADAKRVLALAPIVAATPPSRDDPVDLSAQASYRAFKRRLAEEDQATDSSPSSTSEDPIETPVSKPESPSAGASRWWMAAAAILFLAISALLLRVTRLPEERDRPVANPRTITMSVDVRAGDLPQRESIVSGELIQMIIYVPPTPDGCQNFDVELLDLAGQSLKKVAGLPRAKGRLEFELTGQTGEMWVAIEACGQQIARPRLDFFETPD